ncbi:YjiH family protein [Romboutsia sp.]|uniref:YjiH family protein n=1 Tax=Romboutsia sp. TaxID=1965302 RepID=UPI002CC2A187|nr:YjiH family protein [Romboutsia sp.]HSQ89619.1 YjiH family protein [Romboutsia sp.]
MEKNLSYSTQSSNYRLLKFLIPSLFGLLLFIIPLPYGAMIPLEGLSPVNIGIGFLAELIKITSADYIIYIAFIVIVLSAILSILSKFIHIKNEFLNSVLNVSPFWLICRILGAIFISMTVFGFGPEVIKSEITGQTMLGILPSLLTIFLVSGFLLPLVVDFGLMDLFGTLVSKSMYKLFKVPGRSAVDAISSWLGDGTLGIMITSTQYTQGFYTAKEASIISVCFSLVSLPFSTVIADQLGFMPLFVPFYGTVCLASLACALIMPRIYPLKGFKDTTFNNVQHLKEELVPEGESIFKFSFNKALDRAETAPSLKNMLINGCKTVIDMYLGLLPLVMAWGTLALMVAEFTPFFNLISLPIVYILEFLKIPDASAAAPAILVGFADMFLPSIMVSGEGISQITQFIIGALSITQLIYLTETGAVILKSDIPLNLKDLFVIFLTRTIIALPIITIIAKLIFI